jgi:hypothetical protein
VDVLMEYFGNHYGEHLKAIEAIVGRPSPR